MENLSSRYNHLCGGDYLSNRLLFLWVYRGDKPRGMLGEHEKIASVLSTSQVVYHAGKPIESVLYCFNKITMSLPAQEIMGF